MATDKLNELRTILLNDKLIEAHAALAIKMFKALRKEGFNEDEALHIVAATLPKIGPA